jgi:hypothetical protein
MVHFDTVGPLEETFRGNSYILTALCPFSLFPFAIPIQDAGADTVARALCGEIFLNFGIPEQISSDRAQSFLGDVMQRVCKELGTQHIKSSGYQPQGNAVERFHRFLNASLTINCHEFRTSWDDALPAILYAYRASVTRVSGYSPFYVVYGREAPIAIDRLLSPDTIHGNEAVRGVPGYVENLSRALTKVYAEVVRQQMDARESNRRYRDKHENRKDVTFRRGQMVLVWGPVSAGAPYKTKKKLMYQWSKPMIVSERVSNLLYILQFQKRLKDSVVLEKTPPIHVNRLRPFTPLLDGTPSVDNAAPKAKNPFKKPTAWPKVGELVILLCDPNKDWQEKPFVVGKVVALRGRPTRDCVVHWYGNLSGVVRGPHRPGFVDNRDGKLVFLAESKANQPRYRQWTSAMTREAVGMEKILITGLELTRGGLVPAEVMDQLEQCEDISWLRVDDAQAQANLFTD